MEYWILVYSSILVLYFPGIAPVSASTDPFQWLRRHNRDLAHRHVVRLLDTFEHETWMAARTSTARCFKIAVMMIMISCGDITCFFDSYYLIYLDIHDDLKIPVRINPPYSLRSRKGMVSFIPQEGMHGTDPEESHLAIVKGWYPLVMSK